MATIGTVIMLPSCYVAWLLSFSQVAPTCGALVSSSISGTYMIGPDYEDDPAIASYPWVQKGRAFTFNMSVRTSRYYNCTDPTLTTTCAEERGISVYVPHKYKDGMEAGLLVQQDGNGFDFWQMTNVMDNMIGASGPTRSLPVFVLVSIENAAAGHDGVGTLRDVEYDTLSGKYAEFVQSEVLPAVMDNKDIRAVFPNLGITSDPEGRATMGCSSGAAAAVSMAWFRPDLFRRVLAYSATLVLKDKDLSSNTTYPRGAWEYIDLIKNTAKKPLRIFHSGSQHDLGTNDSQGYWGFPLTMPVLPTWTHDGCLYQDHPIFSNQWMHNGSKMILGKNIMPPNGYNNWAKANNLTAVALQAKGYETRYAYARGACHCDSRMMFQDMPNSLAWMWQGWVPKHSPSIVV